MKSISVLAIVLVSLTFFGFGCDTNEPKIVTYHEVLLKKISFAVQLPDHWEENPITADPHGPADYHEFVIPRHAQSEDKVAGTIGFRLVPRIEQNALEDEVEELKPFIQDSAGTEGIFDPTVPVAMAGNSALQLRWQGVTKNDVEEVWYYTFAFVEDDLLVGYYFDEVTDGALFKEVYDQALTSLEKR